MALGKKEHLAVSNDSKSISCIFHTSGTTGRSKGAMFSNQSCNAMALQSGLVPLKFERGKVMMNQVPPFLAFNILCSIHLPLCRHMQVHMLPDYRPDQFAERIVRTRANACLAGPADWGNFLENEKIMKKSIDLSGLVTPICGSDALSAQKKVAIGQALAKKGCKTGVLEGYGMTEIGSAACCNMPGINAKKSVGVPFCLNNFCVWDSVNDTELTYMQKGEICMTGPTLMDGYHDDPDETSQVLRAHSDGSIWLHSGDFGFIDENGFIYIEGRIKRMIVRHDGIKISPFEIEKTIATLSSVEACCVVGTPDKIAGFGERPYAFISLKANSQVTEEVIRQHCESELNELYYPIGYRVIDKIPITDNGKSDYRTLEKLAEEQCDG